LATQARHWPPLQGALVQVVTVLHCPVASQACTELPLHWLGSLGTHSPAQLLVDASQVNVHGSAAAQWPSPSQVWSMVVEPAAQRVAPGLHSPAHIPLAQTFEHSAWA